MGDHESKKNQHKKGKSDPKEQRKPRQGRNQGAGEKKTEKRIEEPKVSAVVPEKPAFVEPGPEFYQGLKRETDDILKITEEANSKYKKKEILSNWAKYEVPIESYDEVEEQENLGADYEQLIQAPLSLGGHFQFKHEKSWEITTGPSLYDKYFDITMNNLAGALGSIPFYERNGIDKNIFTETDIQTMDQRTSRYKNKYIEIQDKIINSLKGYSKTEIDESALDEKTSESEVDKNYESEISFDESKLNNTAVSSSEKDVEIVFKRPQPEPEKETANDDRKSEKNEEIDIIDEIVIETKDNMDKKPEALIVKPSPESKVVNKDPPAPAEPKKNPVIESAEDLEKWLDDFLEE